ncbi:MAG: ABC transporter permease [Clostridiales bacterium]|nr:ABC transporter permease [Clostridiales bacterium]
MKTKLLYLVRRLAEFVVSLVALALVIFSLIFIAPGDPARVLVGTKNATPELLAQIREKYGLDDPFFVQFGRWVWGALHGNFGTSIQSGQPVTEYVAPHAQVTFELVLFSLVLSIIFGLLFGVVSAKGRGKPRDGVISAVALVGTSAPSFAIGLVFLYIFALRLGLFPIYGVGNGTWTDTLWHLALPAICLTFAVTALIIKVTRASLLVEVEKDYSTFLRARAVAPFAITAAQIRNASAPIFTSTGLVLANLFGGTILVESVFSIPGLGNLLANAVTFHDVPVIQFIALMLASMICLASAVVDIAVAFINPLSRGHRNRFPSKAAARTGEGMAL